MNESTKDEQMIEAATTTPNDHNKIRRFVHQPLTIDHYGMRAKIQENGKIVITGAADKDGEFDQIEIPASLVFKLASLLKATRKVEFVTVEQR